MVFSDKGNTTRRHDLWFLDGEEATVRNISLKLSIEAGARENAFHEGHTVLWTKRSFSANVEVQRLVQKH